MVHAWSVGEREEKTCLFGHNDIVMDLMSMPELDNIVSAFLDTKICLWDAYTGSCRQELKGHKKSVFPFHITPTIVFVSLAVLTMIRKVLAF
jgi:WD40 repeat protein